MGNIRFKMFIGIIIIVALLSFAGYFIFKNLETNNEVYFNEYTPEQEISDEQFRSTVVKLYFKDSFNNLKVESRSIDAKGLLSNPYLTLVNLLVQGPNSEDLEKTIPDGTIINSATLLGDVLVLDLSTAFIQNHPGGVENESATIYSIVNTLTELTEVNSVKFLVDGVEGCAFADNAIKFNNPFVRR